MSDAIAGGLLLLFFMSALALLLLIALLVIALRILQATGNRKRLPGGTAASVNSSQHALAELWEQKARLEQELKASTSAAAPLRSTVTGLRSTLDGARAELALLQSTLEDEKARAALRVEEARERERRLEERVHEFSAQNVELKQAASNHHKELTAAQRRPASVDSVELELQLEKAARRLAAVTAERDEALAAVAKLHASEPTDVESSPAKTVTAPARETHVGASPVTKKSEPPRRRTKSDELASPAVIAPPVTRKKREPEQLAVTTATVITRTTRTKTSTPVTEEPPKQWSAREDTVLLETYLLERSVSNTAIKLRVDQIQVARRLVTLLLSPKGEIDDSTAANHGKVYTRAHQEAIPEAWRDGRKLPVIARMFGRDQLGVGWRLLDDPSQPVELTAGMIPDIVEEAHR